MLLMIRNLFVVPALLVAAVFIFGGVDAERATAASIDSPAVTTVQQAQPAPAKGSYGPQLPASDIIPAIGIDNVLPKVGLEDGHRYCWCGYHDHWVCYGGYYIIEHWDYWGILWREDGGPCW